MIKVEVSVKCINTYDNTCVYSCDYNSENNTFVHSEADDCTMRLASDALYTAHTILKNEIKSEPSNNEAILREKK